MQYSYSLRFNISIVLPIQTILFCYFHMHRGLAYPKLLRSLPHGCAAVNDKIGNVNCPFLDIILHEVPPDTCFYKICTGRRGYAGRGGKNPGKAPACLQRFPSLSPAALLVFFPASARAGIVWIYLSASGNHFPGDSIGHDHCRNFVSVGIQVKAETHRSQLIR